MIAAMKVQLCALALLAALTGPALAGSATLARAADGHWWAESKINGRPLRVLVDTGATLVALTIDDARRAGIDKKDLKFNVSVQTAAGPMRAARVKLESVAVGGARLRDVDALVLERGGMVSVLGMSFLGRMERMDVRDGQMRIED